MKSRKLLIKLTMVFIVYHVLLGAIDLFSGHVSGMTGFAGIRAIFAGCVLFVAALCALFMFIGALIGALDEWFETNTDPIINKICDFINKRNGGCKE